MDLGLADKTVLITGGSKGIGLAIARTFAQEGCHLRLVARSADLLEQCAARLSELGAPSCEYLAIDLAERDAADRIHARFPDVDILVNNAGEIPGGSLTDVSDERWRASWDVKVFGYINLTRAYYDRLKERPGGGVVVNIIGAAGEILDPGYIAGSVGNAALIAFTKSFGAASIRSGVRVVGINPGPVLTDRGIKILKSRTLQRTGSEDGWQELGAQYPLGRMAAPEEISKAVAFLASPVSSYTSGCVLNIDGGLSHWRSIA
jgi:3-oxoacyl-[acyl-carrier protein] reductase